MSGASFHKALVLGVNGQDGSYLAEALCARGHAVIGAGRQDKARWPREGIAYSQCDIADPDALLGLLRGVAPGIVFHMAAIHGAAGFSYESVWRQAHAVNTLSVQAILEYIRNEKPSCGLVYASSAKAFGPDMPARIDEDSPRRSTCIYTVTKNATRDLIDYYRVRHGVAASVLYLFNHESPRRPKEYFVPRVAGALAAALAGKAPTSLLSLDFVSDWGDAREYMDIAIDVAEHGLGQDYIVATGQTWTGRDMVRQLFARRGLDYVAHVTETKPVSGPVSQYRADNARLRAHIGRVPTHSVLDVCEDILRAGME
jgi:GDPmannose 4,6-dehydratase